MKFTVFTKYKIDPVVNSFILIYNVVVHETKYFKVHFYIVIVFGEELMVRFYKDTKYRK